MIHRYSCLFSYRKCFTGTVDPLHLLEHIDLQISKVREEASSRREILEKVEKWLAVCEEESWLEEYNRVRMELIFYFMNNVESCFPQLE